MLAYKTQKALATHDLRWVYQLIQSSQIFNPLRKTRGQSSIFMEIIWSFTAELQGPCALMTSPFVSFESGINECMIFMKKKMMETTGGKHLRLTILPTDSFPDGKK